MADMNVSGGAGTVTITAPAGAPTVQTVLFVAKEVAFAVEDSGHGLMRVTKSVANVMSGIQSNNLVIGKEVAYAILEPKPINRRRASWLFIGNIPT